MVTLHFNFGFICLDKVGMGEIFFPNCKSNGRHLLKQMQGKMSFLVPNLQVLALAFRSPIAYKQLKKSCVNVCQVPKVNIS